MADPLFIVRNSSGSVVLDSRDAVAGACVDLIEVPAGSAPTYTYPEFVGRTALVLTAGNMFGPAVDTALGYPRLIFSSNPRSRAFAVMVI